MKIMPLTKQRLLEKREIVGDCWIWTGPTNRRYGMIKSARKMHYVHRVAYELWRESIPQDRLVCHMCDVARCFNPDHLFLGTAKENTQDMMRKRRNGHGRTPKLTESNVRYIRHSAMRGRALANIFGVSESTISLIRSGKNWAHLND